MGPQSIFMVLLLARKRIGMSPLANAQMPTPAAKRPTGSPRGRQRH
jgi:hypothetical protein